MYYITELTQLAALKLEDAKVLLEAKRYESSVYMAGYAIELTLKKSICKILKWDGFPETKDEFKRKTFLKTHDLILLKELSGLDSNLEHMYFSEWSTVLKWNIDNRYSKDYLDTKNHVRLKNEAKSMVNAVIILLGALE
jgi:HEPN domain-containing protein